MIISPLASQGSLLSLMEKLEKQGKPLTTQEQNLIILQIMKGLRKMHNSEIVHHDIKPENVLVHGERTSGYKAIIADLGGAAKENEHTNAFTMEYLGPDENLLTKKIDMWA